MASQNFLRLKGRTSYFRRKVPADLLSRLASSEICVKLGVIDRDSAVRGARRLAVAVDGFFAAARENATLSSIDLAKVLQTTLADWKAQAPSAFDPFVSPREQVKGLVGLADGLLARNVEGTELLDPDYIKERFVAIGVGIPDDPLTLRFTGHALATSLARHYLETAASLARQHGLDRGLFRLPADLWKERAMRLQASYLGEADSKTGSVLAGSVRAAEVRAVEEPGTRPSIASQALIPETVASKFDREAGPTFSSQAIYVVNERIKARAVGSDAVHNLGPSLRLWLQICGDQDIRCYTSRHMAEFCGILVCLPKIYWRSKADRTKHILQVVAEAAVDGHEYCRIDSKTVSKHIENISSVFEYAKLLGVIDKSRPSLAEDLYLQTGSRVSGLESN